MLLLAGDHDNQSKDAVQSVQQFVQRARLNKVQLLPSPFHGYRFLRLEPKVTASVVPFLETSLKNRPSEWEPEFNLTPVSYSDPQIVTNSTPATADKSKAKDAAKNVAPPPDPKADDAEKKEEPKKKQDPSR